MNRTLSCNLKPSPHEHVTVLVEQYSAARAGVRSHKLASLWNGILHGKQQSSDTDRDVTAGLQQQMVLPRVGQLGSVIDQAVSSLLLCQMVHQRRVLTAAHASS